MENGKFLDNKTRSASKRNLNQETSLLQHKRKYSMRKVEKSYYPTDNLSLDLNNSLNQSDLSELEIVDNKFNNKIKDNQKNVIEDQKFKRNIQRYPKISIKVANKKKAKRKKISLIHLKKEFSCLDSRALMPSKMERKGLERKFQSSLNTKTNNRNKNKNNFPSNKKVKSILEEVLIKGDTNQDLFEDDKSLKENKSSISNKDKHTSNLSKLEDKSIKSDKAKSRNKKANLKKIQVSIQDTTHLKIPDFSEKIQNDKINLRKRTNKITTDYSYDLLNSSSNDLINEEEKWNRYKKKSKMHKNLTNKYLLEDDNSGIHLREINDDSISNKNKFKKKINKDIHILI